MAFSLADRVRETSTTTGLGAITVDGAMPTFVSLSSVYATGDTAYLAIVNRAAVNEWEISLCTRQLDGTWARTTRISSSTGAFVDFGAGTKDVTVAYPAAKAVVHDASGDVAITRNITASHHIVTGSGASPGASTRYVGAAGSASNLTYNVATGNRHTFAINDTGVAYVTSSGVFATTDNAVDFGGSAANRFRDGNFSRNLAIGGTLTGVTSLTMAGALSGVTTLAMSGALSGATTGAFSSNVTVGGTLDVTGVTTLATTTIIGAATDPIRIGRLSDSTTRGFVSWNGVMTAAGGLGIAGSSAVGYLLHNAPTGGGHEWRLNGATLAQISTSFQLELAIKAITDATYDFGASGANRFRDGFLSRNLTVGGTVTSSSISATAGAGTAALTGTGAANAYTAILNANTTASQSYGLAVSAGTNTTDVALLVRNAAASLNFLKILGNGVVTAYTADAVALALGANVGAAFANLGTGYTTLSIVGTNGAGLRFGKVGAENLYVYADSSGGHLGTAATAIDFTANGSTVFKVISTGLVASTDNVFDFGGSGSGRFRDATFSRNLSIGGDFLGATASVVQFRSSDGRMTFGSGSSSLMSPYSLAYSESASVGMYNDTAHATNQAAATGFSTAAHYFNAARNAGGTLTSGNLLRIDNAGAVRFSIDYDGNVKVLATKNLYLDGGGNTFIAETSADTVTHYAGGNSSLQVVATGIKVIGGTSPLEVSGQTTGHSLVTVTNTSGVAYFGTNSSGGVFTATTTYSAVFGSGTSKDVDFITNAVGRVRITTAGNMIASTDATYDFGASAANRFRDGFLSRNLTIGDTFLIGSAPSAATSAHKLQMTGLAYIKAATDAEILVVDGVTGATADLQTWRVNGTVVADITSTGALECTAISFVQGLGGGGGTLSEPVGGSLLMQTGVNGSGDINLAAKASQDVYFTYGGTTKAYMHYDGGLYNYSANNVNLSDEDRKEMGAVVDGRAASNTFAELGRRNVWKRFRYLNQDHAVWNIGTGARGLASALSDDVRDAIIFRGVWGDGDEETFGVHETDLAYLSFAAVSDHARRLDDVERRLALLEAPVAQ